MLILGAVVWYVIGVMGYLKVVRGDVRRRDILMAAIAGFAGPACLVYTLTRIIPTSRWWNTPVWRRKC